MSNLFYAPRIYSQDSAKLYFRATGTSSPQNVYTDADLTVAHSNPVVANSNGYFDPIYLDPTLPDYRVIHTDGSDAGDDYTQETLLWPILDDIPASSNTAQTYRAKGTAPEILFEETDATTDNKKWRLRVNSELLTLDAGDDAESTWDTVFTIDRNGLYFQDASSRLYLVEKTGSFTGTLTGMSGATTGTFNYRRVGGMVTVYSGTAISGTSNTTAMTMTGAPSAIVPKNTPISVEGVCAGLVDNGNAVAGYFTLAYGASWVFTFNVLDNPPAAFTGSGTKGVSAGFQMTYFLSATNALA